jgi:hypothetical protein
LLDVTAVKLIVRLFPQYKKSKDEHARKPCPSDARGVVVNSLGSFFAYFCFENVVLTILQLSV